MYVYDTDSVYLQLDAADVYLLSYLLLKHGVPSLMTNGVWWCQCRHNYTSASYEYIISVSHAVDSKQPDDVAKKTARHRS